MVPIIAIALIVVSDTHKCEALPAYTAAPSETGAGDTSMTVNIERVARVLEAAKEALHRLGGIYRADLASAFGPLGESLTWLCAADELFSRELASYGTLRDNDDAGRTLPGLRFARNHAVHGTDVASVAGRVEGSDLPARLPFVLGVRSHLIWAGVSDLPALPRPRVGQQRIYSELLDGRPLQTSLEAALTFLSDVLG
jgi:hypothetical protein